MRKINLSLAVLLISLNCFSQKTIRVDNYAMPLQTAQENLIVIEMPFGKADIINVSGDTADLKNAGGIFVDVICTDYPSNISLRQLNQQRVNALLQRFSFLKPGQLDEVHIFRQSDGAEREKAVTMFHGLLIKYRPKQTVEAMKKDIAGLEQLLSVTGSNPMDTLAQQQLIKNDSLTKDSILLKLKLKRGVLPKNTGPVKYETKAYDMCVTGYVGYKHFPDDSSINISPKLALKKNLISRAAYKAYDWTPLVTLFFRRIGDTSGMKKPAPVKELTVTDTLKEKPVFVIPDSTLIKIFSRTKWKKFTVVGDVTVSMYPYSAQLLLWIRSHTIENVTGSFVFFNDGDDKPDDQKITGNTGGIYFKDCQSFAEVKKLIKETMMKGSGGDRAENDIEALLTGEKEFPQSDFQVLIADNRAPVKDKLLADKLAKPVRIIICGADDYNLNIDYLNLARKTKGSVHFIEKDFYNLEALHEGENIVIGKRNFKIQNGVFVENDDQADNK